MPSEEKPDSEAASPSLEEAKKQVERKSRTGHTPQRKVYPTITKNRVFATLICLVSVFAFLSFLILVLLAFLGKDPPTQLQSRLADVCYFTITASIGALVGLLGGRAAAPDTWQAGEIKR